MATQPQPLLLLLLLLFSVLSLVSTSAANPHLHHHHLHHHHHHPNHSTSKANATATAAANSTTTSFIWESCKATQYPQLCYHCLSGFANEIKRSERQLALTALAVSLARARSTAEFVHKLKGGKRVQISHRELEAVKDCLDTMGDSVDQLNRSIKELGQMGQHSNGEDFMWHVSNVQTWVSAALTNENTCVDGLNEHPSKGGKVKGAIKMRVNSVAQVTSNALALVNHFADKYQAAISKHPKRP